MKKKFLLTTATAAFAVLTLSSYKDGPARPGHGLNRTGSGTNGVSNCSTGGCHSANTTATSVGVVLMDNNSPVTSYVPGRTYTVMFAATNTSSSLSRFGFQLSAVKAGATSTQAGTFAIGSTPNISIETVSNISIVEHTAPISGTNGVYATSFSWTAPGAGTGTVRFYAIANVVNNNNAVSGDAPNAATFDITENTLSAASVKNNLSLKAYPVPAYNTLQLEIANGSGRTYTAGIYDMSGRIMKQITVTGQQTTIDVSGLSAGGYTVSVIGEQGRGSVSFVKQ